MKMLKLFVGLPLLAGQSIGKPSIEVEAICKVAGEEAVCWSPKGEKKPAVSKEATRFLRENDIDVKTGLKLRFLVLNLPTDRYYEFKTNFWGTRQKSLSTDGETGRYLVLTWSNSWANTISPSIISYTKSRSVDIKFLHSNSSAKEEFPVEYGKVRRTKEDRNPGGSFANQLSDVIGSGQSQNGRFKWTIPVLFDWEGGPDNKYSWTVQGLNRMGEVIKWVDSRGKPVDSKDTSHPRFERPPGIGFENAYVKFQWVAGHAGVLSMNIDPKDVSALRLSESIQKTISLGELPLEPNSP